MGYFYRLSGEWAGMYRRVYGRRIGCGVSFGPSVELLR